MLPTEALALAYALEAGAVDLPEARAWAGLKISTTNTPLNELLDLAVEVKLSEAVSLLHKLGEGADPRETGKRVYRHLQQGISSGTLSHERAAREIIRLVHDSRAPSADAASQASYFDDAFYLAEYGMHGTVAEVKADVEKHLEYFAG